MTKYKIILLLLMVTIVTSCNKQSQGDSLQMSAMRGTGVLQPKDTNSFSFIAFGDSQGETNNTTLKAIFKSMKTVSPKPSFALSLGDIIHGEPSSTDDFTTQIERHLGDVLKLHKLAGIPVFNAPGNHEMDDWIANQEKPSKRMRTAYETIVGSTYGSFDYGNSHFIILNTEDILPVGMGSSDLEEGKEFSYIGEEQLAWLKSDLDANKKARHIIVAMHYPIHAHYPKRDNLFDKSRTSLINLFAKYPNISFVLASHEHQYYNSLDPENHDIVAPFKYGDATQYLISGGAGASMKYFPLPGGFHHYLLFEVDGDNISVTIKRIIE